MAKLHESMMVHFFCLGKHRRLVDWTVTPLASHTMPKVKRYKQERQHY